MSQLRSTRGSESTHLAAQRRRPHLVTISAAGHGDDCCRDGRIDISRDDADHHYEEGYSGVGVGVEG